MNVQRLGLPAGLSASLLACLLAGCASVPEGTYPSLAIRDAERMAGTPLPSGPALAPLPLAGPVLEQLAESLARAGEAHARFLAAAPAVRGPVDAATGAPAGSEDWARAQVALAGLQATRSQAMIALADLDRIYVDATIEGNALDRVEAARGEVTAMIREQDRLIATLSNGLR